MKKTINIIINVLQYLFLFVCVIVILFTISSKKSSDTSRNIFNYQMRLVTTDSMAKNENTNVSNYKIKSLPKNTLVFINLLPTEKTNDWYDQLEVGDVLTFKYVYTEQLTITHRIINIEKNDNDYIITLQGDNNKSNLNTMTQVINTSQTDSPNYIIGKVTGKSILLGLIISLFKNSVCLIFIIIIPCFILIIFEIFKIIRIINIDKINKSSDIVSEKNLEIELLKKKIKQLEQSSEVN